MNRGFTLIELLVVIAMIAVLGGAFSTSVAGARRRAYVSRATQEVKEMTNAILGYEQYARNHSLDSVANGGWQDCNESAMAMILGNATGDNGEKIPVLFNGHVRNGVLRDPWGHPYQYLIMKTSDIEGGEEGKKTTFKTGAALPNFFRLTDKERK